MTSINALNEILSSATTLKYRPRGKTLFLEVPILDRDMFTKLNAILKDAAQQNPLTLSIGFKNEKYVDVCIKNATDSIAISHLRPTYSLKTKLIESNPELVELCLYNYQNSGTYIGTKFRIEINI